MDSEKKRDFVDKFFNSNIFDGESGELKKKYYEKLLNAFQKEIKIESLFRYKSFIKDYDFDDLNNNEMSFSPVSFFNDPFDCDYLFQVTSKNINDNDKLKLEQTVNRTKEDEKNRYRIACLSEDNDSILMWAHYANNHKGVCIEYDFQELIKKFKCDLFPIIYVKKRKRYDQFDLINSSLTFQKSVFLKADVWSYEKEWRILKCFQNDIKEFGKEAFKPKAIYLGYKIDKERKVKLINICKDNDLECWQMQLDESEYKLSSRRIMLEEDNLR